MVATTLVERKTLGAATANGNAAAHRQVTQTLGQPRVLLLDSCGSHVQFRCGASDCANEFLRGEWARRFAIGRDIDPPTEVARLGSHDSIDAIGGEREAGDGRHSQAGGYQRLLNDRVVAGVHDPRREALGLACVDQLTPASFAPGNPGGVPVNGESLPGVG